MLDTALEAKVLANKDESKCLKPLIAVIRPVRDRYKKVSRLRKGKGGRKIGSYRYKIRLMISCDSFDRATF